MRALWGTGVVLATLVLLGCAGPADLQVVQEQRAGDVNVVLLASTGELAQGSNALVLEFRDAATGDLVAVEDVRVEATMPMPGMAPMIGEVNTPVEIADGRYELEVGLNMVGGWNFVVNFDRGQRVQFNVSAY